MRPRTDTWITQKMDVIQYWNEMGILCDIKVLHPVTGNIAMAIAFSQKNWLPKVAGFEGRTVLSA